MKAPPLFYVSISSITTSPIENECHFFLIYIQAVDREFFGLTCRGDGVGEKLAAGEKEKDQEQRKREYFTMRLTLFGVSSEVVMYLFFIRIHKMPRYMCFV